MRHVKWALALVIITFLAVPAMAQTKCMPYASLLQIANEKYQETVIWEGTMGDGTQIMILQSKKGTWTVIRRQEAIACVLANGVKGKAGGSGT